jgi:hypothetical protein
MRLVHLHAGNVNEPYGVKGVERVASLQPTSVNMLGDEVAERTRHAICGTTLMHKHDELQVETNIEYRGRPRRAGYAELRTRNAARGCHLDHTAALHTGFSNSTTSRMSGPPTLLIIPDTSNLLQCRREPGNEWKIVADLDLACLVDDDGLHWNKPVETGRHDPGVRERAKGTEHYSGSAEHTLRRDDIAREIVGPDHVRLDALVQVLVPEGSSG